MAKYIARAVLHEESYIVFDGDTLEDAERMAHEFDWSHPDEYTEESWGIEVTDYDE